MMNILNVNENNDILYQKSHSKDTVLILFRKLKYSTTSSGTDMKIGRPLKNKFPGSNWSVIVMRIEQSEVYVKVFVTKFYVLLTRRGTVTNL